MANCSRIMLKSSQTVFLNMTMSSLYTKYKVYIIKWPVSVAYLSSVLSAREMAGFLTALLHAWLLLQTQKQ